MRSKMKCSMGLLGLGLLAASSSALAEGGIGNGGGAWVCQNNDSAGSIRWAVLVDLFEGRSPEFSLTIPNIEGRSYLEIVDQVMTQRLFPLSRDLYSVVREELDAVKRNTVQYDEELEVVDDGLFRGRPHRKKCLGGTIEYVQLANYKNDGTVLVRKDLIFDKPSPLSETDKAALLIHEAVYAYCRHELGDSDSVRARRIVGLLFSTLELEDLKKEIEKTLGFGGGGLNAIGMEFVKVRPGSFMMGSSDIEDNRYRDAKLHLVQLTYSFEMQTTPVTQKQYFDVMGVNPSRFKNAENCLKTFMTVHGQGGVTNLCPNNPVEQVSFDDVQVFLSKLNANRKDGYFYRLPTEAEWEYAARAGTSTAYSFGNDQSQVALYGWFRGNSGGQTHEVANLRANGLGLYDMYGNVWEMVSDWYGDYSSAGQINPTGASSGSGRVTRGGSWFNAAEGLRSANRSYTSPGRRDSERGFRLVRMVP